MKNRFIVLFVAFFLVLSLCSCNTSDKPLEKAGEEVIALMREMTVSEEYEKLYGLPDSYSQAVARLREGDYSNAKALYELEIPTSAFSDTNGISGKLGEYVNSALYLSLANRINQKAGVEALSVSAAYSAQISFVNTSLKENTVYLYVFDNGYPVFVTFLPGEDGSVRAVGYFIINESFAAESADRIAESFASVGISGVTATEK